MRRIIRSITRQRIPRKLFTFPLSRTEHLALEHLAQSTERSMSGVLRELIFQETANRSLMYREPQAKTLDRSER